MNVDLYLKKHQSVVYKTFYNALTKKNISHAYLIEGETGTPLLDVAIHLGKSLLCDNPTPFACDNCITCMRVDDGNYPDFIIMNGEKGSIKRGDVSYIENRFERVPLEEKGIMIYIIHLVENMTSEATNSILKFLEEPQENVYAFLTTNNVNNVLPTIVSRCQNLRLLPVEKSEIIEEAVSLGVEREYAELLSYIYQDASLIYEMRQDSEEFNTFTSMRSLVELLINSLSESKEKSIYTMEKDIIPLVKSKEDARYFFDMIYIFFNEALNKQNGLSPLLRNYDIVLETLVENTKHLDSTLVEILKERDQLKDNINISLLLDHLINFIVSE
ncbi:MAG: hypothetical protein LUB56_00380 [Coprobacillus sp.]|nr:hypothetical protein [Coprobacillus sp.]